LRRRRPRHHGLRRPLPVHHHPAGLVPVGQPLQRLAARAHPLLAVRSCLHPARRHPDVLPRRPAAATGPDLQLRAGRPGQDPDDCRVLHRRHPAGVGAGLPVRHRAARPQPERLRGTPRMSELLTPSQTVGPYFSMRLPWPEGPYVVAADRPGAVTIYGRLIDGAGDPIPDGLIETWQADPAGRFAHPDDPRGPVPDGDLGFRGFGRCATGHDGTWKIITRKPGPLPFGDGRTEAPHVNVSVFSRGMLDRSVTRIYFPDEDAANDADPV